MILREWQEIEQARAPLRQRGARLAFTNGVFDLLHVGHLRYLQQAASLADHLWVGLNSDRSVRLLKGERRPLIDWEERAELLAALRPVSAVLFFDDLTADQILQRVRPEIYVKGGDYRVETLPESATARAIGADIRILPFVDGRSTTELIQQVLERYRPPVL